MFDSTLNGVSIYLISTLFDIYISILIIRLLLAAVFVDYFNPLTQFIIKLTDPLVKPVRKFLPNVKRLESACLAWIVLFECVKFFLLLSLTIGSPNLLGIFILAVGDTLKLTFQIFVYAIIAQIILSLVQPYSPMNRPLQAMTHPVLGPFQRVIPPISGIDLSPIPALILLQILSMVIAVPLMQFGMGIAVS